MVYGGKTDCLVYRGAFLQDLGCCFTVIASSTCCNVIVICILLPAEKILSSVHKKPKQYTQKGASSCTH